jgi:dTDP-4-dehydrorhamnose 3,5-epimerase
MKLVECKILKFAEIKVFKFKRFVDHRGYFTEHYRKSELEPYLNTSLSSSFQFVQANESYSRSGTIRGLYFQWNPYMGKLVRTVLGRMIDMVLDIRIGSPSFGDIILYDMPCEKSSEHQEWIWIPPGFAHGNFFKEDTLIEYFCTGEYSPDCEAGISPLAKDINWSNCDSQLKRLFSELLKDAPIMSKKDRNGLSVNEWKNDNRSTYFVYQ